MAGKSTLGCKRWPNCGAQAVWPARCS